jgi:SAM-dependent methyltransferase
VEVPKDWYDGFFEDDWLDEIALHADDEWTDRQTSFLVEKLELEPGERVLDLACGHGRLALPLAERGLDVTGVDLSPRSLELARAAADSQGLNVTFVRSDMREIDFDGEFDAAYSVYTSFGYFEEDGENQRVLDAVSRALRPGGCFLIDVLNPTGLAARYQSRMWEELDSGAAFLQQHEFDALAGRNRARWIFVRDDGSRSELVHSVRVYAPWELARMLEEAGLNVVQGWGDFEGAGLELTSRRLILRADKPA